MLREENETTVLEQAAKFYDMYENTKGEDAVFWLEYEAYMSQPIDETENLRNIIDYIGA